MLDRSQNLSWAKSLSLDAIDAKKLVAASLIDGDLLGVGGFTLSSPAFEHGEELDPSFTADEEDAVAPPLEWISPPEGAKEIVIVVEDVDAKGKSAACHWLIWGFPGQRGKIMEGEDPPRAGKNARGNSDWLLPAPDFDDDAHRYVFQAFALDTSVEFMSGAKLADIVEVMKGHVLSASIIIGTYKRFDEDEFGDDDFE